MADNPFVRTAEFIKSGTRPEHYPELGLPEIAVAGRSNVGKSSLINKLVNRRRLAKVSNTPGRTQLLNFFVINGTFALCDLPGYGYAKVPKAVQASWGNMLERYLRGRTPLRALLVLVDCRREPGEWERELVGFCVAHGRAVIPVATKIDKLPVSQRKPRLAQLAVALGLGRRGLVGWSAVTGEGLEDLWRAIERHTQPLEGAELITHEEAQATARAAAAEAAVQAAADAEAQAAAQAARRANPGAARSREAAPPAEAPAARPAGLLQQTRRFTIRRDASGGLITEARAPEARAPEARAPETAGNPEVAATPDAAPPADDPPA